MPTFIISKFYQLKMLVGVMKANRKPNTNKMSNKCYKQHTLFENRKMFQIIFYFVSANLKKNLKDETLYILAENCYSH